MRKRYVRRILAMILSVLMIIGTVPTSVFAEGITENAENKDETEDVQKSKEMEEKKVQESETESGVNDKSDESDDKKQEETGSDSEEITPAEPKKEQEENKTEDIEEQQTPEEDKIKEQPEENKNESETTEGTEDTIESEDEINSEESLQELPESVLLSVNEAKYDSYEQFLAYYYLDYSTLNYYLNVSELPYHTYLKNSDDKFRKQLKAWEKATLSSDDVVEYSTKEIEFYEMLIFDILYQDISENNTLQNINTKASELEVSLITDLAEVGESWTKPTKITDENKDEILNQLQKIEKWKFVGKYLDAIQKGIGYVSTVDELMKKLAILAELKDCSEEVGTILKELYNSSDDAQMKEACRQVALVASGLMTDEEIIAVFSGQVAMKEVSKYACGKLWDGIIKSNSLGMSLSIGQKVGKLASNILCSTDSIVENWYSMEQVYKFETVLKQKLITYKNNFEKDPTYRNAVLFDKAADMYLNTLSVGMTYATKYVEAVNGKGVLGWIYKNFTNKDDYNELMRQLNSIKASIDQSIKFANNGTYNFYLEDKEANNALNGVEWEKTPCNVTEKEVEESVTKVPDVIFELTEQHVSKNTAYESDKTTYSNYYLESGTLDLEGKTLTVYGDFCLSGGTVNLNGGTLEIRGDLKVTGGKIYVNGGSVEVGGNAYFANKNSDGEYVNSISAELKMNNEADSFTVKGNVITNFASYGDFNCSSGVMNIGGNWTNYYHASGTGNFKVVLTGTKDALIYGKYNISIPELEIENALQRKVTMQGEINAGTLTGGDANITAKSYPYLGFGTTKGKLNINGNVELNVGTKAGGDIDVKGECIVREIALNGKNLKISEDFRKGSGKLYLNGGSVEVGGNAYFASKNSDGEYVNSISAELKMNNEADSFTVKGNVITNFASYGDFNCSSGVMNIGGNWINYNRSISGTGSFKVVLTGTKDVLIYGKYDISIPELEIENASQRKITMQGEIKANTFTGENVNIITKDVPGLTFNKTTGKVNIDGNVRMQISTQAGGDVKVSGNLYSNGLAVGANTLSVGNNLYLSSDSILAIGPSGKLNVTGDVWFNRGTLSLAGTTKIQGNLYQSDGELKLNGGEVEIDNDYRIQTVDVSSGERIWNESYGTLSMAKAKEKLTVNGDFYVQSRNSSTLNAGLITLKGNFYQLSKEGGYTRNFLPTGTHTVMLAGTKPQKVSFESTESKFNILQVTQDLTQYTFNPNPCWNKLEEKKITPEVTKVAEGSCGDNLNWVLTSDGKMTVSGKGTMRDYSSAKLVPWYQYREQVVAIELGKEITSIGNFAFYGLPNLKKVSIPEGVNSIGGFSFKGCTALTDVKLPTTLKKLGESAFFGCSSLREIEIPEGLYTVWGYTFKNCTKLEKVTFPSTLVKIDEAAFYGCSSLKTLTIPDNVSIIGIYCFKNCTSLSSVQLSANIQQIREAVFYGTAITELKVPDKVTSIGAYAFKNCTKLKNVTFSKNLTKIDDSAFYACSGLTVLNLPDSLTDIKDYAFRKCTELKTVNFSAGLKTVGESSFYGCEKLTELKLPEGVTDIKGYAFKGCIGVTTITLPTTLKTMGESAFYGCTGISKIEIPKNVTTVEAYAFSRCSKLSEVIFKGDAPTIGDYAFAKVTANVSYPSGNTTWSKEKQQNYGGELIWNETK